MNKVLIGIIGIIIAAGIIYYAFNMPAKKQTGVYATPANTAQQSPTPTDTVIPTVATPPIHVLHTVTYTNTGFSPKTVNIKVGDTVKFVNNSSEAMWVGVDEHPTHMQYDGTNLVTHCATTPSSSFDQCAKGNEYSFTFRKAGRFEYHNHSHSSMGGVVVATQE